MGWENRKGRSYYYTKERDGARVVSRYVGRGETAQLIGQFSALRRKEVEERRAQIAGEFEAMKAEDIRLDEAFDSVEKLMKETLTAAGYHQHNRGGDWRKKRDGKKR